MTLSFQRSILSILLLYCMCNSPSILLLFIFSESGEKTKPGNKFLLIELVPKAREFPDYAIIKCLITEDHTCDLSITQQLLYRQNK